LAVRGVALVADAVGSGGGDDERRPVVRGSAENIAASVDGIRDGSDVPVDAFDLGGDEFAVGSVARIAGPLGRKLGGTIEGFVTRRPDDTSCEALAILAAAERILRIVVRDVLSGVVRMAYFTKFNSSSDS